MDVPLETFMERFTAEERMEIDGHAKCLIENEMSLRDLRKAMGKTQAQSLGRPPLLLTGLADLTPEEARPNERAHGKRSTARKREAGDTSRK